MSYRILSVAALIAALVACAGCRIHIDGGLRGDGDVVETTREIEGVEAVHLSCPGELEIELGERESLLIRADGNLLEHIETEVDGGVLKIRTARGMRLRPSRTIEYVLVVRELQGIRNTGSGDIAAPRLETGTFAAKLTGSGDLEVAGLVTGDCYLHATGSGGIRVRDLEAARLEIRQTGSGDLRIDDGSARRLEAALTGSGECAARGLATREAEVSLSGSGGFTIHVDETLTGRITGSGDIVYGGTPEVDVRATGSGRAVRR